MSDKKKIYFCGVDVEKTRVAEGVGILAVAFVLTDEDGVVIEEKCFSAPKSGWLFDHRAMMFWRDFPEILDRIDKHSKDVRLSSSAIRHWLTGIHDQYGPFGQEHTAEREFRWICDDPGFKISEVNGLLREAGANKMLCQFFDGYVPTSDPAEQFKALTIAEKEWVMEQVVTPHSHYPTEDAKHDIEMYIAIRHVLAARKE